MDWNCHVVARTHWQVMSGAVAPSFVSRGRQKEVDARGRLAYRQAVQGAQCPLERDGKVCARSHRQPNKESLQLQPQEALLGQRIRSIN